MSVTFMGRRALFLDRDGVVIEDAGNLVELSELRLLDGAAQAIARANARGFFVVVVTNQPVVARGLTDEDGVRAVHTALDTTLRAHGARVDEFRFCPHHPNANLERYRLACACRKPRPGMLVEAAREHDLDLAASVMVGDRISDVAAGKRAGCKAILVQTGRHAEPPIESPDGVDDIVPDHVARDLAGAVDWVMRR